MRKADGRKREVAGEKLKSETLKSEIGNIEISWFKFMDGSSHSGYDKYRHSEQL
jgi:hypothetical protein